VGPQFVATRYMFDWLGRVSRQAFASSLPNADPGVLLAGADIMPFNVNDPLAGEGGPLGLQGLSNNEVDAVRQTILSWTDALVKGDLPLWDSYWAQGGILMPPDHGCVVGQSKRDALAETPPYDDIKKATFSDWAIVGRGDLAVASNNIEIEPKLGGAPAVYKQLIVMRQQGNGKWLVQAVMFNSLASSD
jgi:ketosteroid isomerase-like protein